MTTPEAIAELMNKYNEKREEWITRNGTDAGFDTWFTGQVFGR